MLGLLSSFDDVVGIVVLVVMFVVVLVVVLTVVSVVVLVVLMLLVILFKKQMEADHAEMNYGVLYQTGVSYHQTGASIARTNAITAIYRL